MSDASLAAAAVKLIAKRGRPNVQIVRPGKGKASDPATPWKLDGASGDAVLDTVSAVFMGAAEYRDKHNAFLTQGSTDVAMIATSSLSSVPMPGDIVYDGSNRYSVIGKDTVQPGSTPILTTLHLEN